MTEEEKMAIEELESATNIFNYVVTYEKDYLIESIKVVLNLIQKLQEENKKKDKIIDLMAEFIDDNLKDCLLNILPKRGQCEDTDRFKTCKNCIKQYFENKTENLSGINTIQEEN